jgi:hypothetical protein
MALTELKNTIARLKAFDFHEELQTVVEENREVIADLQAEQLAKGVKSDGNEINPPYSPFTVEQKQKHGVGLGRITDHVTFYDTGEMYSLMRAEVSGDQYEITNSSFKFDKMKKRSGERVVGLNDSSKRTFAEEITIPNIKKVFKQKTGLNF